MHAADVKTVFRVYSIDVPAREKDDLKEDPIVVRLRKVVYLASHPSRQGTDSSVQAGGASYDGV